MKNKNAFTLVEVMVVVGLLVVFLGFGLSAGANIKDQLAYYRDQQVIIAQIYKARALAITTLEKDAVCGYGVEFSRGSSSIRGFAIEKPSFDPEDKGSCEIHFSSPSNSIGSSLKDFSCDVCSALTVDLEAITISKDAMIAFIPPSPLVKFKSGNSECVTISSETANGAIKVNRFGQVTTGANCGAVPN